MGGMGGIVSLFISFLVVSSTLAQDSNRVAGKLFTINEALEFFGEVKDSVVIDTTDVNKFLDATDKYIMFLLRNNEPVISDYKRNILFNPANAVIADKQIMHLFSVSKIKELIESGGSEMVKLENREGFFTISNGHVVLELGDPCPPYCN